MIETKVHGRPPGDDIVADLKTHHVEAFVDANRVDRVDKICRFEGSHVHGNPAAVPLRRTDVSVGSKRSTTGLRNANT